MTELHHWVEADRAVRNPDRIIGYSVWRFIIENGKPIRRKCVRRYPIRRGCGWQVALHLANALRDDLNGHRCESCDGKGHSWAFAWSGGSPPRKVKLTCSVCAGTGKDQ